MPSVLTPLAEQDLIDIWDHVVTDNIDAAHRVLGRLEAAMRELAKTPRIGHFRENLADRRQQFFLVYSYLIVYRAEAKPMQAVSRVARGAGYSRTAQGELNVS